MSSPLWATRFGLSDHDFAELQNQLAGTEDPLRWCLLNGRIPLQEYLQWAADTYSLPILRDDFFQIPADPVFWEAVKADFAWTPSFFPLAEWHGVMLIGCLEPPKFHVPFTAEHRLVVASAQALEKRFRAYEPAKSLAPVPLKAPTPNATVKSLAPSQAPLEPRQVAVVEKVRQRPADEVLAEDLPAAPDVSLDDPDGLLFEIAPVSTPNLFIVPDGLSLHDIGQPISTKPDGLDHDSMMIDLASFDFSAPVIDAPSAPMKPVLPKSAPSSVPLTSAVPAPRVPPAPPVATPTPMPLAPDTIAMPPPIAVNTARLPNSEPNIGLASCSTPDELMTAVSTQIASIFEQGLVLSYIRNELRPAKWSDLVWSAKGEKPDAISLDSPSLFRVVFRSSLPYHGYVTANPVNTLFFNDFNRGILAKHVTLVPVMVSGQLNSMIMGVSLGGIDFKATLAAMEKLAVDYASQLEKFRAKKAA